MPRSGRASVRCALHLRFFAVRQRPMTPVLPRSLSRIMLRQTYLSRRPPILKGASPLLYRWAYYVETVRDISDCATATHKDQLGSGQMVAAAAQISTWTGSWFSRTRHTWFTGTIVRAGRFGRLSTAALASANAV